MHGSRISSGPYVDRTRLDSEHEARSEKEIFWEKVMGMGRSIVNEAMTRLARVRGVIFFICSDALNQH